MTVNNYTIWRRHMAHAKENGGDLRNYMTSGYASSMVFLSLLLSAELSVLFNSSQITTDVRHGLQEQAHFELKFWIGLTILISIIMTLLSLIITYTAWGMVSAISDENAHCILRSSIGQYVLELPHRFIVTSIYSFFLWIIMFIFLLLPVGFWSILLVTVVICLFIHVMTAFSSFGRLILHTTAMSPNRIFEESYEKSLTPQPLQEQLHTKALAELSNGTSITRQYRRKLDPLGRKYEVEELAAHMKRQGSRSCPFDPPAPTTISMKDRSRAASTDGRKRTDSTVRFADQLLTTIPSTTTTTTRGGDCCDSRVVVDFDRETTTTLTPVTEASSQASSSSRATTTLQPPSISNVEIKIPPKPYYSKATLQSDFSLLPPAPPPTAIDAPRGFSISSLEGWLEGSTPISTPISTPVIDDDERKKTTSDSSRPTLPLIVGTKRSLSVASSFEDDFVNFQFTENKRLLLLSDDEKFDLDYGDDDFLFESSKTSTTEETTIMHNETKRLLDEKPFNYSSTKNDMV